MALAGWLAADVVRLWISAADYTQLRFISLEAAEIAIFVIAACLVLRRPPPRCQDASLGMVAIAFSATLPPMLYGVLNVQTPPSTPGFVAQAFALALMTWSILCLGTNFSVLPQFRVLVTRGPYRWVRHPLYASYLLFDGALVAGAGNVIGGALWLAELALLSLRARREEKLLEAFEPFYRFYKASTPYLLIPLLLKC